MIERESFLFYRAYLNAANRMNTEQKAKFYEIVFAYGLDGIEPKDTGDPLIDMALDFVRPLLGANIKNYINGKKGGAPSESMKGNQNARKKTDQNQTENKPKQTENKGNVKVNVKANDKDKEKANANDKDNVNVNVNVNEKESVPHYSDDPERNEEIIRALAMGAVLLPDGSLDYSGEGFD